VVINEEEAGIGDRVAGIGRNGNGKDFLSELVGFEAIEDVGVELIGVDYLKCLIN